MPWETAEPQPNLMAQVLRRRSNMDGCGVCPNNIHFAAARRGKEESYV
jgi:hypothetical protein